jgi:16S rRNA (guanine966-N2)-methyltransferase
LRAKSRQKGGKMNIRVIAGKYGGRQLAAPHGRKTHPMGERIRNALFNSLGDELQGATVLDAFAGTGSLGIEAVSRGAKHATFVEKDRTAYNILVENITTLNLGEQAKAVMSPVASWASTYKGEHFDIILADPPYHDPQFSTVKTLMGLLKPRALMVLSHSGRDECPTRPGVVVVDNRSYGNATLVFFRLEDNDTPLEAF